ncbi:uncharacterized protein N7459_002948 [Penicillium hispanicum]|uniref:uncharacterized protein n=1 Tax=Penicillium hispanicum TaxID=1080232 RepID=UPI002540E505|nr:uncharacterized protein N7459_002948 [Penicillium hispanicum]KAJ5587183.1 hypothetical protein N7459_002948 [Penicillium hispanicum]
MVLDDASPQASPPGIANASSASPTNQPAALLKYFPVTLKPELVVQPDPFTLYFGFLGSWNWKRKVAETLSWRVESSWVLTARAPTQEEMDAFTTISTRSLYYRRVGVPLSSFLGTAYLYNQARKSPHFPRAVSPAQLVSALRDFSVSDPALFRQTAGSAVFKMIFVTFAGGIISSAAGTWSDTSSLLTDPRLQQFLADMKQQKPEDIRRRQQQVTVDRVRRLRSGEPSIGDKVVQEVDQVGGYRESAGQEQDGYDNLATTSTSPASETSYNTTGYDGGYDSTEASMGQPGSASEALRNRPPQRMSGAPSRSSSSTDFFFGGSDDDDASPTAPEYRYTNPDGSPSGSAWARIRNQSAGTSRPTQTQQPRTQWGVSQTTRDGPSASAPSNADRYENEQRREKEQARADFDRMMDAERNASSDEPSRSRGWWS